MNELAAGLKTQADEETLTALNGLATGLQRGLPRTTLSVGSALSLASSILTAAQTATAVLTQTATDVITSPDVLKKCDTDCRFEEAGAGIAVAAAELCISAPTCPVTTAVLAVASAVLAISYAFYKSTGPTYKCAPVASEPIKIGTGHVSCSKEQSAVVSISVWVNDEKTGNSVASGGNYCSDSKRCTAATSTYRQYAGHCYVTSMIFHAESGPDGFLGIYSESMDGGASSTSYCIAGPHQIDDASNMLNVVSA